MAKNNRENKYPKIAATRVPVAVWEAMRKYIKEKQKDFPRYSETDFMRSAMVNHLKAKGFLEKGKDYL